MSVAITTSERSSWYVLDVRVEPQAREAIEYGLMEAGALGTESKYSDGGLDLITAYFSDAPEDGMVDRELNRALQIYDLPRSSLRDISFRQIEDRDWLAEWKRHWQPVTVGRFIITPPWLNSIVSGPFAPGAGLSESPIVIQINPGMAFGTGTHETTRLCLSAIEKYFAGGSFLDVGTGTGILAIAAAKICPNAHIEACDTDPDVIAIAHENARLNQVAERINFRVGTVSDRTASADLVCANLTAPLIIDLLPQLLGVTCGRLILSGILESQVTLVQSRLLELGAADFEISTDGEWISIVVV